MELSNNFKLVDGKFNPTDAKSVLFALINSKINFHSMESFGITIRSSGDTTFHEQRIKQLTEASADIKAIIKYAEANNLKLKIKGNIEIKLMNEKKIKKGLV